MSLYYLQKVLYDINRNIEQAETFKATPELVLRDYELSQEEITALTTSDVGLLYVMGVNGQILMHFAAMCGLAWPEYIQAMRDGIEQHGPVRAGLYKMTDGKGAI